MDNLLKSPHVMLSAHFHLPTLSHREKKNCFTHLLPQPPQEQEQREKNQSPEIYLTVRKMNNVAAQKTNTNPITLTCPLLVLGLLPNFDLVTDFYS